MALTAKANRVTYLENMVTICLSRVAENTRCDIFLSRSEYPTRNLDGLNGCRILTAWMDVERSSTFGGQLEVSGMLFLSLLGCLFLMLLGILQILCGAGITPFSFSKSNNTNNCTESEPSFKLHFSIWALRPGPHSKILPISNTQRQLYRQASENQWRSNKCKQAASVVVYHDKILRSGSHLLFISPLR